LQIPSSCLQHYKLVHILYIKVALFFELYPMVPLTPSEKK